jgi:monooxygenase
VSTPAPGYVDVLIVGAGLSGIGAACHLQALAPGRSFAIAEARAASGGTWDLFRFPGIRSDSDMFTLGYTFRPWTAANAIAGGGQILRYLRDTAAAHGVDEHISYHSRVVRAAWSGADARWTVTIEDTRTGTQTERRCGFLYLCAGYYRYDQGYTPQWPGRDSFAGRVVHPQHWPDDLDLTGQRVVVIGSGATAVTLVPAIAARAAKVTMVQRSPSYVMALPARDPIAGVLRAVLPERRAYAAIRWKNARIATTIYQLCRRRPDRAREMLTRGVRKRLPDGYDVATHFTPAYNPWDQRLCLTPDGDFFDALSSGRAEIVTDHIEAFTPAGLRLRSGAQLEADVIITATGLNLRLFGGIELTVDGEPVTAADHIAYKAMMLEGVPNMAFAVGYTNASWTLKVDLVSAYVARIVAFMAASGYRAVTPRRPAGPMGTVPFTDMTSGYFQRARDMLPSQGDRAPWRLRQHFFKDATLYRGPLDTDNLMFTGVPAVARRAGLGFGYDPDSVCAARRAGARGPAAVGRHRRRPGRPGSERRGRPGRTVQRVRHGAGRRAADVLARCHAPVRHVDRAAAVRDRHHHDRRAVAGRVRVVGARADGARARRGRRGGGRDRARRGSAVRGGRRTGRL